ncbi:hypothetical protein HPT25_18770 [Bacillus sp. BRMEA1]|uniref:FliH/SctL family protein n=1 Tax=Neobacillus endophyticus TaxID=2738405 RepID=UPI001566CA37|nr:FliH/SctL family protein [Neobacillus endophyticus]NRD79409.1 hypothetical protein [Neobacillus endophyticus]
MNSYSKVFKASNVSLLDDIKVISKPYVPMKQALNHENGSDSHQEYQGDNNLNEYQIIQEANETAKSIIEKAEQDAHSMEEAASEKINLWWEDNHQKLAAISQEAKEAGYQEGIEIGKQEAIQQIRQEYEEKLNQANQLLNQAYEQKAAIISEAEPFLIELSTVIASQIIKQELSEHPDKFVDLVKQHILRFKEKEYITVCVHPDDFDFIQGQRAHLISVVNGETEFKILPDHSVSPKGCVIRTAYGSVDARIDTQIEEIKKVILEARGREQESDIIN